MDKKVVQTPLMKMLNPLYHFNSKEEEERDFQAIRMYRVEAGDKTASTTGGGGGGGGGGAGGMLKVENLVGTDIFVMEDLRRQEETKYENEQNSLVNPASKKDEFSKPYRRDVEVIRVLKRMHIERASKVRTAVKHLIIILRSSAFYVLCTVFKFLKYDYIYIIYVVCIEI
jgi:hypothetical protein